MLLKTTKSRPPTGWVFEERTTKASFSMPSYSQLTEVVRSHRIVNKMPRSTVKEVQEDIQSYICEQMRGRREIYYYCNTPLKKPIPPRTKVQESLFYGTILSPSPEQTLVSMPTTITRNGITKAKPPKTCKTCG